MEIEYSSHFKRAYLKLDIALQRRAEDREALFRKNPFDPRLETHKLLGKLRAFYSFSIDRKNRIVFKFVKSFDGAVFLDIGDHNIYR